MLVLVIIAILFLYGMFCGLRENKTIEAEYTDTSPPEADSIHKQERIEILDNTLVQYNKLLDSLAEQLKNETDEKKRAVILSKQIATLEKIGRAHV